MTPAIIIELVQMVIAFLLQLFGKNPAAVKSYIDGSDTNVFARPFVLRYRAFQLRVFTNGYAVLHGLDPAQVNDAVTTELKKLGADDIAKVANQLPVK
jgi:hypothetical protein